MLPTTRQLEVFNFIAKFMHEKRMAPTLRDICQGVGLTNQFYAHYYINELCRKGYLTKTPHMRQSLRIVKYPEGAISPSNGGPEGAPGLSAECRAAYARGVHAGRASAFASPEALDKYALEQAYKRGYRAGKADQPKNIVEAFDRGIVFGREEMKRELTMVKPEVKFNLFPHPNADSPPSED